MKRLLAVSILCLGLMILAGCGSKHYTITTADGNNIVSDGEPKFIKKSNTYKFENLDGQEVILKREDVKEIRRNEN